MPKQKPNIVTLKKGTICPGCGMTIEKGAQMYRSLTKPNTNICTTCAIKEQKERKRGLAEYF